MVWKKKQKNQVKDQNKNKKPRRKAIIPAAFREQIWLRTMGKVYEGKCPVVWCQNNITVHDFQSGHNIPESKGGKTAPDNLIPICSRCNQSMGNRYTIEEWNTLGKVVETVEVVTPSKKWWCCF
jgi:5-methylcytosine-specific restriction endonuclease McrA